MLLYYITDRCGFPGSRADQRTALLRCIAESARAGVDYIQLREKDLDPADLELLAREVLHVVRKNSPTTRLLINTYVQVALAAGADGVHLPADAPSVSTIRQQWLLQCGREPLLGLSAHAVGEVQRAEHEGATFAVLAPIFEKAATGAAGIGLEVLREACTASRLPVFALGGVTVANAHACLNAGAAGIAGIRLFQTCDPAATVRQLRVLATAV